MLWNACTSGVLVLAPSGFGHVHSATQGGRLVRRSGRTGCREHGKVRKLREFIRGAPWHNP